MSLFSDKTQKVLQSIGLAIFLAVANVFICLSTSGVVMLQLLAAGTNKYISLCVALLVAIGCNAYIVFNHKIRNFIKNTGDIK
jgi:hypothetical protein